MLRDILTAIIKALKWFVGWPRPVLTAQFSMGDVVWYKIDTIFSEIESRAGRGIHSSSKNKPQHRQSKVSRKNRAHQV